MLFMGEEWGASTPFAFFTSHPEPDLGRAVSEGRIDEFAQMDWDTATVPDPQDPATFAASKLDWSERETPAGSDAARLLPHAGRAPPYASRPSPTRTCARSPSTSREDERWLVLRRGSGIDAVVVVVNLGDGPVEVPLGDDVATGLRDAGRPAVGRRRGAGPPPPSCAQSRPRERPAARSAGPMPGSCCAGLGTSAEVSRKP